MSKFKLYNLFEVEKVQLKNGLKISTIWGHLQQKEEMTFNHNSYYIIHNSIILLLYLLNI